MNPIFYSMQPDGLVEPVAALKSLDAPLVGDPKGRWGAGTNHHLALRVASRTMLLKWKRYLTDQGVHVTGPYNRHYFHAVYFRDPDGAIIELAIAEPGFGHDEEVLGSTHKSQPAENMVGRRREEAFETWPNPIPAITFDMALIGFHHIHR